MRERIQTIATADGGMRALDPYDGRRVKYLKLAIRCINDVHSHKLSSRLDDVIYIIRPHRLTITKLSKIEAPQTNVIQSEYLSYLRRAAATRGSGIILKFFIIVTLKSKSTRRLALYAEACL